MQGSLNQHASLSELVEGRGVMRIGSQSEPPLDLRNAIILFCSNRVVKMSLGTVPSSPFELRWPTINSVRNQSADLVIPVSDFSQ